MVNEENDTLYGSRKLYQVKRCICMNILRNNPISINKDEVYGNFAGLKDNLEIKYIRKIIFKINKIVEHKILAEVQKTAYEATIHDR